MMREEANDFVHRKAYTDAPKLQSGVFSASFRLLFWLFFHPSAWRHHLSRIDHDLHPDFCLAELGKEQWKNTAFWRLLLMLYLSWPALVALSIVVGLWAFGASSESMLVGVIVGVAAGIVTSLAASIAGSVAIGVAVGIAVGVVVGIGSLAFTTISLPAASLSLDAQVGSLIGLASGLAGGLSFGVAGGLVVEDDTRGVNYSLTRQISGAIIGVLIGLAAGWLVSLFTENWAAGIAVGLPFGVAVGWRTNQWQRGVIGGLLLGIGGSLAGVLVGEGAAGILGGIAFLALVTSLFALPYVLAERIAGPWAGALAGALGSGGGFFLFVQTAESITSMLLFSLLGILLGLTLAWWRPVLTYPFLTAWNILLLRLDERRLPHRATLLPWHSAFWDEFQRLPLQGLDQHLLLVMAHAPDAAGAAMDYLSTSHQRWAAQAAQIELDARQLEQCHDAFSLGEIHNHLAAGELTGPASALLRSFSRISRDVEAAHRQESAYNQRLALHAVEDRLDGLLRELTRSNEPYAARFRPIAASWRQLVAAQNQLLAEEAELRQEIDSPYIIGVPLTEQQEIFVGRTEISARIEQLLLDRRQPPLLLYGQRRVGKTSLLNNLGRLLPSTILPLFVDLQGPASRATDNAGFLYNMGRAMIQSAQRQRTMVLPPLVRDSLAADPFTRFDEWLDEVEAGLGDHMVLLMLDEFEVLAGALAKGRFEETAVLGMLRHLIQHRPRFKVLLSGSHTLDEFHQWASYLINVQVIHIGYLSQSESRQLIEHPVRDFALRYDPQAIQRVLDLTRGHPFLVQLLCAEIVALKNDQPPAQRRLARVEDVETAVPAALAHGSFFFADIHQNQAGLVEGEILRLLASHPEGSPTPRQELVEFFPSLLALEQGLARLQNQELIEAVEGGYCFQVEMMRRWFASRG